jgi:hypothetical protein
MYWNSMVQKYLSTLAAFTEKNIRIISSTSAFIAINNHTYSDHLAGKDPSGHRASTKDRLVALILINNLFQVNCGNIARGNKRTSVLQKYGSTKKSLEVRRSP